MRLLHDPNAPVTAKAVQAKVGDWFPHVVTINHGTRISSNTEHEFWMTTINTSEYSPADSFQSRSEGNVPNWCQSLQGLMTAEVGCKMLKNTLQETKINHPWNNVIPTKTFLGWGHCMCCFPGRLPNHPETIWGKHCVDRNISPGRLSQKHPFVHRRTWQESRRGFQMFACSIHLLLPLHLIGLVFQSGLFTVL